MINKIVIIRILLIISIFGVPGILKFDRSGVTHEYGLLNIQSILRIIYYLFIGYLTFLFIAGFEKFKINYYWIKRMKVPMIYYLLTLLLSIPMLSFNDLLLSMYFIYEWILFFIILYLYQKYNNGITIYRAIDDIIFVIWLKIITLLVMVPFFPSLTLMGNDIFRLGGYFLGPNVLGVIAGMLAFYYYFAYKDNLLKKYLFFILAITIIILTNSRGAIFSFILAFSLTLILSRYAINKIIFTYFLIISLILIRLNMNYILRGLDIENITSLSERIPLWLNYYFEFLKSPLIGYGFISGVKNLSMVISKIHWIAPHAHNDFIQALMSGGIIMAIFTLYIYISIYKKLINLKIEEDTKLLIHGWLILIFIYSMLTPVINWKLFTISGFFWIIFIALNNEKNNENFSCS